MKNDINNKTVFAIRLKQLRKESGMTQLDLAQKLKVTRSGIANWENGGRLPGSAMVLKIATIFHVPVDYLYGMSNHRYNVKTTDYFELDLTKLNSAGIDMLHEYYMLLLGSDKYKAKE